MNLVQRHDNSPGDDCGNDYTFWRRRKCLKRLNRMNKNFDHNDESGHEQKTNIKNKILRDMSRNGNVINIHKVKESDIDEDEFEEVEKPV
jgi:hypothetical protein